MVLEQFPAPDTGLVCSAVKLVRWLSVMAFVFSGTYRITDQMVYYITYKSSSTVSFTSKDRPQKLTTFCAVKGLFYNEWDKCEGTKNKASSGTPLSCSPSETALGSSTPGLISPLQEVDKQFRKWASNGAMDSQEACLLTHL